jgi:hypothetical protein
MTKTQAAALQEQWKQWSDAPVCEHLYQEMENTDSAYVTGNYHCLSCGEFVSHT